MFRANSSEPGHLIRLFDGELPSSKSDRKKQKPDFEALTLLPAYGDYPHGALLALGSGSRPNRRLGALLALDTRGAVHGPPQVVDLAPILASLDGEFPALNNIESAVVSGAELRLFQRGNKRHAENAIIRFQLSAFLDALSSEQTAAIAPLAIRTFDLGQIEGIPFCFTDAAAPLWMSLMSKRSELCMSPRHQHFGAAHVDRRSLCATQRDRSSPGFWLGSAAARLVALSNPLRLKIIRTCYPVRGSAGRCCADQGSSPLSQTVDAPVYMRHRARLN